MSGESPPAAFYTVSDERYFLGAVGLVNSLRLVGHTEPIHVLDLGLTDAQRELLAPEATIVEGDPATPPWLSKTIAPLRHPADVMVLIDADMIVTRPLTELIERARDGSVIAVEHGSDRFFEQWAGMLGLESLRRRTYLSSGLIVAPRALASSVLALMDELQDRVDFEQTVWRRDVPGYPFLYGDQDVFNAVLASRVAGDRVVTLERRLEAIPPFEGLELIDEATLRCAYADGTEPYLLHHYSVKPWLELTLGGVYGQLLRRLLLSDDVSIRVAERDVPRQLRYGFLADAVRRRAFGKSRFRSYVRDPLVERIRVHRGGGAASR